jgi:predicted AlkP superfamily phosphohydrolase/phosphomutase
LILVLAYDGLDPDLCERFERERRLPNLSRLAREGRRARLRSSFPPASIPAWTTFLCGAGPGSHGLFDFTRLDGDRVRFQNAADRRLPGLIEILDAAGLRAASIGVPGTFPVPRLRHGAVLAGFDSPVGSRPDPRGMHPPDLWRELDREGVDLRASTLPEGRKRRGWHERARDEILRSIERRVEQTRALLRRGPWELMLVHFQAADTAGHHFFRYLDAGSPRYEGGHPDRSCVIPEVYQALDRAAEALIGACPPGTRCLVVSDHGMGAASDCVIHLNRWLELEGYLTRRPGRGASIASWARSAALRWIPHAAQPALFRAARGLAGIVESRVRLGEIDLARSTAYSEESSTLPGIWVRDASIADELMTRLRGWDAVTRVHRREDLYRGPERSRAPHILLELRHGLARTPASYRGPAVRRLGPPEWDGERGTALNGTHRPEGTLIAWGWGTGPLSGDPWIGDLAPTILASLAAPVPGWMEGRVMEELGVRAPGRPDSVPSWIPDDAPMTHAEERRVERRLRALGYLG